MARRARFTEAVSGLSHTHEGFDQCVGVMMPETIEAGRTVGRDMALQKILDVDHG